MFYNDGHTNLFPDHSIKQSRGHVFFVNVSEQEILSAVAQNIIVIIKFSVQENQSKFTKDIKNSSQMIVFQDLKYVKTSCV